MNRLPSHLLAGGPCGMEDISGQARNVRGILSPKSVEDVLQIVAWARSAGARLQPISCGNNWGFGSQLPPEQDAYILDLSGLNRIRRLACESNFVELEPGVTQGQLDAALRSAGRTHFFNVTGAGTDASLIGNALERGIGYFGPRHADLLDLEVVLASGEILHTAAGFENPHHTGLGSNLTDLFVQSTLGVVTSAKLRLHKRPACMGALLLKPDAGTSIGKWVETISNLQAEGCIRAVPHIGNRQRAYVTFAPFSPAEIREQLSSTLPAWTCVIPISGSTESVAALRDEVVRRMEGLATCELVIERGAKAGPWVDSLLDLSQGIPSNIALPGVAFAALGELEAQSAQPEKGNAGLIHLGPTCRPNAEDLTRLLGLIDKTRVQHRMADLPMTINLVNAGMAVAVISVPFDRRDLQAKQTALAFARALKTSCFEQGFTPYRLGVGDSSLLPQGESARESLLDVLKANIDPGGTFCNSKYRRSAKSSPAKQRRNVSRRRVETSEVLSA